MISLSITIALKILLRVVVFLGSCLRHPVVCKLLSPRPNHNPMSVRSF